MRHIGKLLAAFAVLPLSPTSPGWAAEVPMATAAPTGAPPVAALIPETRQELIFVPIQPCRAISNQTLAAGQTKNFRISGTGLCGVPNSAQAVAINLSAPASAVSGSVTAFATGAARPGTASLTVPTSGTYGTAGSIVTIGSGQISIYSNKPTTIFGDVTGYFAPQIAGQINVSGNIQEATSRVVSSTRTGVGNYTVTLDRDVSSCVVTSAPFGSGGFIINAYSNGNTISAFAYRLAGTAVDINWQFHIAC